MSKQSGIAMNVENSIELNNRVVLSVNSSTEQLESVLADYSNGALKLQQEDIDLVITWLLEKPQYKYELLLHKPIGFKS